MKALISLRYSRKNLTRSALYWKGKFDFQKFHLAAELAKGPNEVRLNGRTRIGGKWGVWRKNYNKKGIYLCLDRWERRRRRREEQEGKSLSDKLDRITDVLNCTNSRHALAHSCKLLSQLVTVVLTQLMYRELSFEPLMNLYISALSVYLLLLGIITGINPLIPDAHYSERQDKLFSLQIQGLEVDLKLNRGFLFFALWALMG